MTIDVGRIAFRARSTRVAIPDAAVREARDLLKSSGILAQLDEWNTAEHARLGRHPGGAPSRLPDNVIWVALTLAALTDAPLLLTECLEILFCRISPAMRRELGLPDPPDRDDPRVRAALYRALERQFHRVLNLIDPSSKPKNRRLSAQEFAALETRRRRDQRLDQKVLDERRQRLTWVLNRIVEASLTRLPRRLRRQWRGDVAVDATPLRAFARREKVNRHSRRRQEVLVHSADPDAGLYTRTTDNASSRTTRAITEQYWAFEATLIVSGDPDGFTGPAFPNLVMAMAPLHRPGEVAVHAINALSNLRSRGYPARYLAGDRAYSNAQSEKFQLPGRALGYQPVFDYKKDQLGIQDSHAGAIQVDGAWYCPAMPKVLIAATSDYRNRRIDERTWRARIDERRHYQLRPKAHPDREGHQRLVCPAAPGAPTAQCALKPASRLAAPTRTLIALTEDLLAEPPKICTQQSVTVPPEAGAKFAQPLAHHSHEWERTYATLRNCVEGYNFLIKDGAHNALGDSTRRRVRGVAAQSVFAAFVCMATNLRQISGFLANAAPHPDGTIIKTRRPRRRTTRPLSDFTPAHGSSGPSP